MTSKTSAAPTSKPESAKTGQTKMWLAVAGVVVMTVLSASPGLGGVEIDLRSLIRNWSNGYNKLLQMLQPNFEFIPRTIGPMLEALQMAWVGAAISAIISVPLTLWAARVTNQSGSDVSWCARSSTWCAPYRIWFMQRFWSPWWAWVLCQAL